MAPIFGMLALSCAKPYKSPPSATGLAVDGGVRAGDSVVIESTSASFADGKVISVARDHAQVQLASTGETRDQRLVDLYVPSSNDVPPLAMTAGDATPAPTYAPLHEGSFAVCHMPEGRWRGCRIESIAGSVHVVDDEAKIADLAWREIVEARRHGFAFHVDLLESVTTHASLSVP